MAIRVFPSSISTSAGRTLAEKNTASILGYVLDHRPVLSGFTYVSSTTTTITLSSGSMIFDGYQVEVTDSTSIGYYDDVYSETPSAPVVDDVYYIVCFLKYQDNVNEFLQTVVDDTTNGNNILRIIPANFYVAYLQNKETYSLGGYLYRAQALYSFTYAASMTSASLTDIRNFLRFDPHVLSTGWFENLEFVTDDTSFNNEFTISKVSDPAVYYDKAALLSKRGSGSMDLLTFLYEYADFIQTGIRGLPSLKRGSKTFSQQYDTYNTYDSNQNRDDCLTITTETYGDTTTPSIYNKLRYNVVSGATTLRAFDFINTHIKYSGDSGAVVGDILTLDSSGVLNALYLPKASTSAFGVVKINNLVNEGASSSDILSISSGVLTCNAARYAFKTFSINLFDYNGTQVGSTSNVIATNNNSTLTLNYGNGLTITNSDVNKSINISVNKVLNIDTVLLQNGGTLDTTGNKGVAIRFNSQVSNNTILNPAFMFVKNTSGTDSYISGLSMIRDTSIDYVQVGNITTPLLIKANDALNFYCSNSTTPSTTIKTTLTSTSLSVFTDLYIGTALDNKTVYINGDLYATGRVHDAVWNDYAEFFEKEDKQEIFEPGDVIAQSLYTNLYTKADCNNSSLCVGVYSNSFGHILGGENVSIEENMKKYIPVGLIGRVKVKVYGPIMKGDLLMPSFISGVAIKANKEYKGSIIGKALETKEDIKIGLIEMLIMPG